MALVFSRENHGVPEYDPDGSHSGINSTYDADGDGIVDNAKRISGKDISELQLRAERGLTYPTLINGRVPFNQLPTGLPSVVPVSPNANNGLVNDVTGLLVPKGEANGVGTLDATGVQPASEINTAAIDVLINNKINTMPIIVGGGTFELISNN